MNEIMYHSAHMQQQESYDDFRERIFGSPYAIWHDGPDMGAIARIPAEDRERAFLLLLEGLGKGDDVAVEALGVLDPVRALPEIQKLWNIDKNSKQLWLALAEFLRQHDPAIALGELANVIIGTLRQNNVFSINAVIVLRHYPVREVVDVLLMLIAKHQDYLIRYHAVISLLCILHDPFPDMTSHGDLLDLIRGPAEGDSLERDFARYNQAREKLQARFASYSFVT